MRQFTVVFSQAAVADLSSIHNQIAEASDRAIADGFVDQLVSHCEGLAYGPHRGTVRNDIRQGVRIFGWRRAVTIAFAVDDEAGRVDIAGIFYRGRDVAAAMRHRT